MVSVTAPPLLKRERDGPGQDQVGEPRPEEASAVGPRPRSSSPVLTRPTVALSRRTPRATGLRSPLARMSGPSPKKTVTPVPAKVRLPDSRPDDVALDGDRPEVERAAQGDGEQRSRRRRRRCASAGRRGRRWRRPRPWCCSAGRCRSRCPRTSRPCRRSSPRPRTGRVARAQHDEGSGALGEARGGLAADPGRDAAGRDGQVAASYWRAKVPAILPRVPRALGLPAGR